MGGGGTPWLCGATPIANDSPGTGRHPNVSTSGDRFGSLAEDSYAHAAGSRALSSPPSGAPLRRSVGGTGAVSGGAFGGNCSFVGGSSAGATASGSLLLGPALKLPNIPPVISPAS